MLCAVFFVQLPLLSATAAQIANEPLTDSDIAWAVETDLITDPMVSAHLIDVKSNDGVVTLSGSVDNLLSKERAVKIAKSIRGVRAVVNQVQVKPVSRKDRDIARDIELAWLRDPATESYELDVKVKDGIATLTGQVQSWQEKQLAEQVAKGVRGLKGVNNEVTWEWTEGRLDSEIQAEIERRLESDIWVHHGLITTEVKDGKVTLRGSVGSITEKNYAETDAWVAGVKEVDGSELTINPWLDDEDRRSSRLSPLKTDQEIAKAVEDAFLYDPRLLSFKPTVEVEKGVVTLTGVVENLQAKIAAEQDAKNTLGVRRVENRLKVRLLSPPADEEIAKSIRAALTASPFVNRLEITVRVQNQKAYLSGLADSLFEKKRAGDLAAAVKGVVDVENNLIVRHYGQMAPHSYTYHYYYPYSEGLLDQSPEAELQIKQDVESQLFWSPFVDSEEIIVTVEDGMVTLSGMVDSMLERAEAIDNAYQAGALFVKDELELKENAS
ncbi:MAG: BON domain-containing protein [Desulfurivibrionaceae bacterium]|nr:BON domain-containing protein [Desulfurivibrionaceae bacterium]